MRVQLAFGGLGKLLIARLQNNQSWLCGGPCTKFPNLVHSPALSFPHIQPNSGKSQLCFLGFWLLAYAVASIGAATKVAIRTIEVGNSGTESEAMMVEVN